MRLITDSVLEGEFEGWDGDTIFQFVNGEKWQQSSYDYYYNYSYRPKVKVLEDNGNYLLEVEGIEKKLPVRKIS